MGERVVGGGGGKVREEREKPGFFALQSVARWGEASVSCISVASGAAHGAGGRGTVTQPWEGRRGGGEQ
jgi:hypothetical protein